MFNLRLCNAATIRYSLLKFWYMHLCGKGYKYFSPHCCKCNSFGYIAAIRCGNACRGPHSDSVYSGSEHRQFNSPRLVKREAGFPNPRRALIGSNQLWRVDDSSYYREYVWFPVHLKGLLIPLWYETLVVNWQNWLFTLFHQIRSVLSPNPIHIVTDMPLFTFSCVLLRADTFNSSKMNEAYMHK